MITATTSFAPTNSIQCQADQHADFLPLRARVERHARFAFRHLPAMTAKKPLARPSRPPLPVLSG